MEDYIYIILLIAWVLFGFYRRSQKKAAAAREASSQPQPDTKRRPFTLEDLFEDEEEIPEIYQENEGQQPARPVYRQAEIPEMMRTEYPKEYAPPSFSSIGQMEQSRRDIAIERAEYQQDITNDVGSEFNPSDIRENIRMAVIYSEILNRPYD